MLDPLARVEDLEARVGEPITDPADRALAIAMLRKASASARNIGIDGWTWITAPDVVVTNVVEAASRGYNNPAGYLMERGDMVSFQRDTTASKGAAFTKEEIAEIRAAAGKSAFYSVSAVRPDIMSADDTAQLGGTAAGSSGTGGGGGSDVSFA